MNLFKYRPSHIDGHNHIHTIPVLSKIICKVSVIFGIYTVRMPICKLLGSSNERLNHFNSIFLKNSLESKTIYEKNNFICP